VSRHLLVEPKTDAALFDMMHALLGVGDFDDSGEVPWFKFRMTEIQKIKAMRRKRCISLAEFATAARYCYRRRIPVRHSWEVAGFLDASRKEARAMRVSNLSQEVAEAISNERSRAEPDEAWIRRLLLARGEFRRELLDTWAQERT
jgi:hypothetical protein